jgi:hypothetical protein
MTFADHTNDIHRCIVLRVWNSPSLVH